MAAAPALVADLLADDAMFFHRFQVAQLSDQYLYQTTRLSRPLFMYLVHILTPTLQRRTRRREAVPVDTQLLVALGFYASGGYQWATGKTFMCHTSLVHNKKKDNDRTAYIFQHKVYKFICRCKLIGVMSLNINKCCYIHHFQYSHNVLKTLAYTIITEIVIMFNRLCHVQTTNIWRS